MSGFPDLGIMHEKYLEGKIKKKENAFKTTHKHAMEGGVRKSWGYLVQQSDMNNIYNHI